MKSLKTLVLPIVCIVLCVTAIITATVFTTPMVIETYESKQVYYDEIDGNYDFFEFSRKCGWIMEIIYKYTPSVRNLQIAQLVYGIHTYLQGTYYGQTAPKGYLEKNLKFSKLLYESEYDPNAENFFAVAVGKDNNVHWKLTTSVEYLESLYLNGEIDEMKRVADEVFALFDAEDIYYAMTVKEFFYLVYSDTKDESLKAWVLEKETFFDDAMKAAGKSEKFYSVYDSHYTNPDYKSYVFDKWPEHESDYINKLRDD